MLLVLGVVVLWLLVSYGYLRQVRAGRADVPVDPSWPSLARPAPNRLPEPPPRTGETSLYHEG